MNLWWNFCILKGHNPFQLCLELILEFLQIQFRNGLSYGSINTIRLALSLVISPEIGNDPKIKRFCKGVFRLRPSKPKYNVTWNPESVLKYLETLYPHTNISLTELCQKLTTLLALITAHRVQTLTSININNIEITTEEIRIKIPDFIKTSGLNKLQPLLIVPFFKENPPLCAAGTLLAYLNKTAKLRPPNCNKLFISTKRPYKPASSQTISRWIKSALLKGGIDTSIFKSHSTRHIATSAAARNGLSIDLIKKTARWTESSKVFANFYNKPLISTECFAKSVVKF